MRRCGRSDHPRWDRGSHGALLPTLAPEQKPKQKVPRWGARLIENNLPRLTHGNCVLSARDNPERFVGVTFARILDIVHYAPSDCQIRTVGGVWTCGKVATWWQETVGEAGWVAVCVTPFEVCDHGDKDPILFMVHVGVGW